MEGSEVAVPVFLFFPFPFSLSVFISLCSHGAWQDKVGGLGDGARVFPWSNI
jgi:hypothetical protein